MIMGYPISPSTILFFAIVGELWDNDGWTGNLTNNTMGATRVTGNQYWGIIGY
jgi:hypothetical protein